MEQAWEKRFLEKLELLKKPLEVYAGKRTVVHRHAQPFARGADLAVVQVINPGELTPKVVGDAVALNPMLLIDIYHFPIAKVIADNTQCRYIEVIKFPGVGGPRSLEDLFEYNASQLRKAFP